ncbi:MAG: DinB family protein [Acidobacteriaceae bacterium]|nr:DinB family protein [Acidobacteriaceae bacterium]MBV9782117.1 DinB family protein [Acidobacteriaceae bacterium]
MIRYLVLTISAALMYGFGFQAEKGTTTLPETRAENPLSAEVKQFYNSVKNNILKSADEMPAENYGFKPTPEIRSFAQVMAHVAESQMRTCSAVVGQQKSSDAGSKTAKPDIVAALKDAFAQCDKAYDTLVDADATQMIKTPRGDRSKMGALIANAIHDNEQYGILSVYLRLKGLVPPSSQH